MSTEAFPILPPDARAELNDLPTDLRAVAQDRLRSLSHNALFTSDDFIGNLTPIPGPELGEAQQPHIDAVAQHMLRTSELLSSAHKNLLAKGIAEDAIEFEALSLEGERICLEAAIDAKNAGDKEAAVLSVESLLVISALSTSRNEQVPHSIELGRSLVEKGLATELVEASFVTFGMIAIRGRFDTRPLSELARENTALLHVAADVDFSDDFSEIAEKSTSPTTADLLPGDFIALIKSKGENLEDPGIQALLGEALTAGIRQDRIEPKALAELLVMAQTAHLEEIVAETTNNLRNLRDAGNGNYRVNDSRTYNLDNALVGLAVQGQFELVKGLLSSYSQDIENIKYQITSQVVDSQQAATLLATITEIHTQKQQVLRESLAQKGVDETTTQWILDTFNDPDDAVRIPESFWPAFQTDTNTLRQLTENGGDLATKAQSLLDIRANGLEAYSREIIREVYTFKTSEERSVYLASLKVAFDTAKAFSEANPDKYVDLRNTLSALSQFTDPSAALAASESLFGRENFERRLYQLRQVLNPNFNKNLASFREEDIPAFGLVGAYCDKVGIPKTDYLSIVSERIRNSEDPQKTAAILVEAFEIAHVSKEHNVHLYWDLAKTDDPLLYARALSELESYFNPALEGLLGEMQESILYGKIPEVQAQIYKRAEQTLQQYGLSLEVLGKTARGQFVGLISSDESMAGIEKFCSNWKIENEYTQAYGRYLKPGLEAGSMKGIDRSRKPNVTELPELHARLKSFGLDDETVQMIFGSWSSYSAIQKRLYENGDRETITSADIETVVPEQGKQLRRQLTRLTDYAEAYGNDEVKSIIETFGIVNFIRYKPEQLHNQLISWQSGETVAHNIVISARSDWNGAISDAGESFERVFGQDGYFCFEANDSLALARIAVAVGNRERAAGRDPETLNAIDNFVIDAHANPYGLLLGVNGEHLDAVDYVKSSLDERRANTYARHLGNKFRIILKACSTAGEVSYGKNIAESISEHHNVVVAGSKTLTSGSVTIESDGTVIFNGGKEPAVVYDNRE